MRPAKELSFEGNSLDALRSFPAEARRLAGFELDRVQNGLEPSDWKPMSAVGPGVREIRIHVAGAYRVIYLASRADRVYVLHAFHKATQQTAQRDVALARQRLKAIRELK